MYACFAGDNQYTEVVFSETDDNTTAAIVCTKGSVYNNPY